jgi:photosystem II stability/assembly factor-like uncharacterized protein
MSGGLFFSARGKNAMNKWFRKAVLCGAMLAGLVGGAPLRAESSSDLVISDVTLRSDRTALLAAAMQGQRAIAVGERGTVFVSENGGSDWKGLRTKKTTRTLTSVVALNDKVWLAGGHGGVLLRSDNGGQSAELIENDAGAESILGLLALDERTAIAYGAFGTLLRSEDAGLTWARTRVIDEEFDRHIYGIVKLDKALILVGESGTVARSDDNGLTWQRGESPYEGSFFGGMKTPGGALLLFGMRGSVYRSDDAGANWAKIETDTLQPFYGSAALSDGTIVLAGGRGFLAVSKDDGRTFELSRDGAKDIGGLIVRSDQKLVGVGALGVREIALTNK